VDRNHTFPVGSHLFVKSLEGFCGNTDWHTIIVVCFTAFLAAIKFRAVHLLPPLNLAPIPLSSFPPSYSHRCEKESNDPLISPESCSIDPLSGIYQLDAASKISVR